MPGSVSLRLFVVLAVVAAGLTGGCGTKEAGSDEDETAAAHESKAIGAIGRYPADRSLSPAGVVRAYVEAINGRQGRRFCELVAPYISGRFDLETREPDRSIRGGCPRFVSGFIGYTEEAYQPKFKRAEIKAIDSRLERGLLRVDATMDIVFFEQPDSSDAGPSSTGRVTKRHRVKDVIWLARFDGAWRLAKLSAVAAAASLALPYRTKENPLARPDPALEQRRFKKEVAAFARRAREREASYRSPAALADCSGGVELADRPNDPVDYQFPAPRTPIPRTPRADLRRLQLRSSSGRVCVYYEAAGDVASPAQFSFSMRTGQAGSGFLQVFAVEIRRGGNARVTSGEDDRGRPITVPATVGIEGRSLSLVLDRETFARSKPAPASTVRKPPLDRFAFQANITTKLSRRRTLNDPLDRGNPTTSHVTDFVYPGGRACRTKRGDPC